MGLLVQPDLAVVSKRTEIHVTEWVCVSFSPWNDVERWTTTRGSCFTTESPFLLPPTSWFVFFLLLLSRLWRREAEFFSKVFDRKKHQRAESNPWLFFSELVLNRVKCLIHFYTPSVISHHCVSAVCFRPTGRRWSNTMTMSTCLKASLCSPTRLWLT